MSHFVAKSAYLSEGATDETYEQLKSGDTTEIHESQMELTATTIDNFPDFSDRTMA